MEYALFVVLAFASSAVSAVFGLGSALLVIALGSYLLPIKETIALATILFTAGTVMRTVAFRQHIDWQLVVLMTVFSAPFAYLGALALTTAPTTALKVSLGAMCLAYVAMGWSGWKPKLEVNSLVLALGSAAYGFVSGLLGTGNVIKAVVFDHMGLRKEAFVGVMAATSVVANFVKIGSYWQAGLFTSHHVLPGVGLVLTAIAATFLGRLVLKRVAAGHFRTGVLIILAAVSISLIFA